jgi:hypothetical protein
MLAVRRVTVRHPGWVIGSVIPNANMRSASMRA